MPNPKERKSDIKKFCLNCGQQIERKKFNGRIEDYAIYKRRKYCDHGCYVAMKKKTMKVTAPTTPTKAEIREQIAEGIEKAKVIENLTPLEYLIREMNTTENAQSFRKECAIQAAPYVHPKLDAKSTKTKKEERAEAASKVTTGGRFAPTAPPKIIGRIG
jgi:hypothetical protein